MDEPSVPFAEQPKAETELPAQTSPLEALLSGGLSALDPNPNYLLNSRGDVLYANPAGREVLPAAGDGLPMPAPPEWIAPAREALASGQPAGFEWTGGGGLWRFSAVPAPEGEAVALFGAPGRPAAGRLQAQPDLLTEQRSLLEEQQALLQEQQALQSALSGSEERFRLLTQSSLGIGVIYDWDIQSGQVFRSEGQQELLGLDPGATPREPEWWFSQVHPEDLAASFPRWQQLLDSQDSLWSCEYRVRHAEGHWVHVWDRSHILRDAAGRPTRAVGIVTDISTRKIIESHAAFLTSLAERLATADTPDQAAARACRQIGEYLQVDCCVIDEIDPQTQTACSYPAYCREGLPDREAVYPLSLAPPAMLAELVAGRQVIENEAANSTLSAKLDPPASPPGAVALISTPGMRDGVWMGTLNVTCAGPRRWQDHEALLLKSAADLVWLALEKTRLVADNLRQRDLLERVVHSTPAAIAFLAGPEHRFTLVNPAYEALRGGGPILGRQFSDVWPVAAKIWLPLLEKTAASRQTLHIHDMHVNLRQLDESYREAYFNLTITPIFDAAGEIEGLVLLQQETTEQVLARREIETERARLKALIDSAPEGITLADREARVIMTNPAAERLYARPVPFHLPYGTHAEMRVAYPDGAPYDPRDLPLTRSALDGEVISNLELLITWPDGQVRQLLANSAPVRDSAGSLIGAVSVFQDITERKKMEARLAYHAQLLENVHDAILATDAEGRITAWNRAAEKLYGWSEAEVLGKRADELLPLDFSDEQRLEAAKVLERGVLYLKELAQVDRDGKPLLVDATTVELRDEQGRMTGYLSAIQDVSQRKEAEDILLDYSLRLERSNRDLQDFAFIASHDLQEPLRKVRAFGDLLKGAYGDELEGKGGDYVNRMQDAAQRMQVMIDSLLEYSRLSSRQQAFERVDLQAVAQEVTADLELRLAETGGSVEIGELPAIYASRMQMHQLLQNLIGNALKFHHPGVPPRVRVQSNRRPDDRVEITVSDNGIGFSMQFAEQIFQPFQRLVGRSAYPGSGIGLAVCRKIVELHGGSISVRSEPNQGAVFTVILPDGK